MKLNTKSGFPIQSSGQIKELNFGIKSGDMGIILEILRSKMYKNPIAAICREISSNARDANREAEKKDSPIRISVDDSLLAPGDLTISFTDDGPGISPDRMADVFVNYGASTKRNTNEQTGAFGLGAKTPFAYADSFSIMTTVDKVCYTYVAAIEENNTGKIYLLSKEKVKESNGTSIIIPVNKSDLYTFQREIVKTTYFWKVRPEYINFNFEIPKIKKEIFGNNLIVDRIVDQIELFENGGYLLIDEIPYKLDSVEIGSNKYNIYYTFFLSFKTGSLTISANREAVQYDKKTISTINNKFEYFLKSIRKSVETSIQKCKSFVEACIIIEELSSERKALYYILKDNNKNEFSYKGDVIDSNLKLQHIMIYHVGYDGSGKEKRQVYNIRKLMLEIPVYMVDTFSLNKSRSSTIFKEHNRFYAIEFAHRELRKFSKLDFKRKRFFAKKMREALNELKWLKSIGLPMSLYSNVKQTKEILKERKKPEEESIYTRKISSAYRRRYEFVFKTFYIKPSEILKFLERYAYHVMDIKDNVSSLTKKWAYFLEKNDIDVLFIRSRHEKHFLGKILTWEETVEKLNKKDMTSISDYVYLSDSYECTSDALRFSKLTFSNGINKSFNSIIEIKGRSHYNNVPNDFIIKFPPSNKIKKAVKDVNEIKSTYKLLKFFNGDSLVPRFNEYIRFIDNKDEIELMLNERGK